MNLLFRCILKILVITGVLASVCVHAQDTVSPTPIEALTYTVKPDYRKCLFPMCGGWFLTPVNQYSHHLESDDEAYENSLIDGATIYVAYINYRNLRLSPEQIKELQAHINNGQALLRGKISRGALIPQKEFAPALTLHANGAWIGANKTQAYGPYLNVASSGIVCITTPCPYYKAELINTLFNAQFDDLNLEKAELDREQTARAWQAIAAGGLVMTGVKYRFQGMTGPGTGIAATKVFFSFPEK